MSEIDKGQARRFDPVAEDSEQPKLVCRDEIKPKEVMQLSSDDFFDLLESSTADELQEMLKTFEKNDSLPLGGAIAQPHYRQRKGLFSILIWWELRRPAYNLAVGLCGLLTLISLSVINHVPGVFLLFGSFCYFVAANLFYSLASFLDILVTSMLGEQSKPFGKRLFMVGTALSIMITLAIAVVLPLSFLIVGI